MLPGPGPGKGVDYMNESGLSGSPQPAVFSPLVRDWFLESYGQPTAVQVETWELAESGGHVLSIAPTGSGKTLAAFTGALSRFASGEYPPGALCVLYVSPLKALNEDIRKNLETPVASLSRYAREHEGKASPVLGNLERVRIATRSGDTPESERRTFLKSPPSILCTTPESLMLLLDSPKARAALSTVRLVVMDEIHAIAATKRGSLFACSIGRLALLAGEFQRIALSATVASPETMARFVGGYVPVGRTRDTDSSGDERGAQGIEVRELSGYCARSIRIVSPQMSRKREIRVEWPSRAVLGAAFHHLPSGDTPSVPAGVESGADAATGSGSSAGAGPGTGSNTGISGTTPDRTAVSGSPAPDTTRYAALVPALLSRIRENRSTLVFCDSRRQAEKIARLLNESGGEGTAWAHHGSLSREVRKSVETRLKEGRLACVVATASLELGIDVGSVDEVVLAGSPPGFAVTLQRIGRAGHSVGSVSRARLFPFHGMDLLWAAALMEGIGEGEIETSLPVENPLDILAQVILSLVLEAPRTASGLYSILRCFPPYIHLDQKDFEAVLGLLAGKYALSRLATLEPRILFDPADGMYHARDGVRMLLYSTGGSIPDRGLFSMRMKGSGAKIGELDEEFVWERKTGDSFTFGSQSWRIVSIGPEAVEVIPLQRPSDFMPFWKGGPPQRSGELARRLLSLVDRMCSLDEAGMAELLESRYNFSQAAAREAARFLHSQKIAQSGLRLPGPTRVSIEVCGIIPVPGQSRSRRVEANLRSGRKMTSPFAEDASGFTVIIHTLRGVRFNRTLAFALVAAWEDAGGIRAETQSDDTGVALFFPALSMQDLPASMQTGSGMAECLTGFMRDLADPETLYGFFRSRLESSGIFAAAFRENAGRALLLPRGMPGKRVPLWITRLRARRLYEAVHRFEDFPVIVETWQSVARELFDLEGVRAFALDLKDGLGTAEGFESLAPSPFASSAIWNTAGSLLYQPDDLGGEVSSVSEKALERALKTASLRPSLDPEFVAGFVARRKRILREWAPESELELAALVCERVLVPVDEWNSLDEVLEPGLAGVFMADRSLSGRLCVLRLKGAGLEVLVESGRAGEIARDPSACVIEWLGREGPVSRDRISQVFGLNPEERDACIVSLVKAGLAVDDVVTGASSGAASGSASGAISGEGPGELSGHPGPFCQGLIMETQGLELLLRMSRRLSRKTVRSRPGMDLFALVQKVQGLGTLPDDPQKGGARFIYSAGSPERLSRTLDLLSGYPAPASLWESELIPVRAGACMPGELDQLLADGSRFWYGCGRAALSFASVREYGVLAEVSGSSGQEEDVRQDREQRRKDSVTGNTDAGKEPGLASFFLPGEDLCEFWQLKDRSGMSIRDAVLALWTDAWNRKLSSQGFAAVRSGLAHDFGFKLPDLSSGEAGAGDRHSGSPSGPALYPGFGPGSRRVPRALRSRMHQQMREVSRRGVRGESLLPGSWFLLEPGEDEYAADSLEREEACREVVRILGNRYGFLAPALFDREDRGIGWSVLFPAIRTMELSGELVHGHFFEGIRGPQFLTRRGWDLFLALEAFGKSDCVWLSALDPASPAGFSMEERPDLVPQRSMYNRICMAGGKVVAVSTRSGAALELAAGLDEGSIRQVVDGIVEFRSRLRRLGLAGYPDSKNLVIESVNGRPAPVSPYVPLFRNAGFEVDRTALVLW